MDNMEGKVSYKPLWRTLVEREMTKTELRERVSCSTSTLARLGKNEFVGLDLICKICKVLNCRIEDVVEYVPDNDL